MEPQRPLRFSAGQLLSFGSVLLLLAAVVWGLTLPGCREQSSAPVDRNKPPETILVGVPGDSTTGFYRQRLRWTGYDEDGTVVGYEWAITDSLPVGETITYRYTTRTDSLFLLPVDESREILGHRFYVRAIDNEGRRDPVPAFTFFTVRDNAVPVAWFTMAEAFGPAGEVRPLTSTDQGVPRDSIPTGWGVRFAWTGTDNDRVIEPDGGVVVVGRVVGYDYKLGPLEIDPILVGAKDTTRVYEAERLRSQTYEMRVRARDDAGLAGNDPAVRTFVWNLDPITQFSRALLDGHTDSSKVFLASTQGLEAEYLPHTEGDTLPLTSFGVLVRAQVRAVDPDPPYRIIAREARLVKDAAFWTSLLEDGIFNSPNARPQYTGDYKLMCRSLDVLDRWDGSPDTIRFSVNRQARFLDTWVYGGTVPRAQRPRADGVYRVPSGVGDTLRIRFGAVDSDFAIGSQQSLEYNYLFESYPLANGQTGGEVLYCGPWRQGELTDPSNPGSAAIEFTIPARICGGRTFIPGDYVLLVVARELYPSPENTAQYGYRLSQRRVRFTLESR